MKIEAIRNLMPAEKTGVKAVKLILITSHVEPHRRQISA